MDAQSDWFPAGRKTALAYFGIVPPSEGSTMPDAVISTDLAGFIGRLDAAEQAHMAWLRRLLRCSILKTPPGDDALADDAHRRCAFGKWFMQHREDLESIGPMATQRLEEQHRLMHDAARSMCKDILSGTAGNAATIDAFERTQTSVIANLTILRTQCLANSARVDFKLAEKRLASATNKLLLANMELAYHSDEKDKRAAELVVANVELAYQSDEKAKRAAELVIANVELAYQSDEKDKRAAELVLANLDLVKNKKISEKVWNLAFYDALTNLPNRRLLNDRLAQAMASSNRSLCNVALMMLDLDNFKPLNDTHGHVVGDLLLVEVGRRLKACVREVDTVARFGGDEFVVMLSGLDVDSDKSIEQAGGVAEKIRASLAAPFHLRVQLAGQADHSVEHQCSASIGVVVFVNHRAGPDDIMRLADAAMYQAKKAGRNAIRFHGGPLNDGWVA
jgi:diguanylate cyclase (GGDEF)-like protein